MKKCHKLFIAALVAALSVSLSIAAPATVDGYFAPNGYVSDAYLVNGKVVAVVDFARVPAGVTNKVLLAKVPAGFLVRGAAIKPEKDYKGGTCTSAASYTANIGTNGAVAAAQAFSQLTAVVTNTPSVANLSTPYLVPKGNPQYLYIVPSAAVSDGRFVVTLYGDRPFMD
jgi:hypothetical protein